VLGWIVFGLTFGTVPPGFPPPLIPADNPLTAEKVELGRRLFYDERLSGSGTFACASCHRQELAFTDGRPRAIGATGEMHPRGAMSLANVAYNASFAWADPCLLRLEDQARVPMFNESPVELGVAGREEEILDRFRSDEKTLRRFRAAFPEEANPVTMDNLVRAIASFERTLFSGNSTFHNTGLYNVDGAGAYPRDNPGIHSATGLPEDMGKFRAPTLRNIAVTAPYMHDGSLPSLDAVIDFYAAGGRLIDSGPYRGDGRANPFKSERVAGFELTLGERQELIAFLESLTDSGFLIDPRFADPERTGPERNARQAR